jgi:hypothetical protein
LIVVILGVILGLVLIVVLIVLVLLWTRIEVEIITVLVGRGIRETKRVGEIFRPVPEKVAYFAVVYQFIIGKRQRLMLNVFHIHELKRLW